MDITVIGATGYVGLTTALGFAGLGHRVVGVDIDEKRVAQLQAGSIPFYENGLDALLARNSKSERMRFTTELAEGVRHGDVLIVAVGTPSGSDGRADLSQILRVAEGIMPLIDRYKIIVIKSTASVGSVELIRDVLGQRWQEGEDFDIVCNPEFLREGQATRDFFFPDRIVIGTGSQRAREVMRELYAPFITGKACPEDIQLKSPVPLVETDIASAQMTKYASNAFLATRVSFINEIAGICEQVGANVQEVVRGMSLDPRIGSTYLDPGVGFGGPCLEKDVKALMHIAGADGFKPMVLKAVLERNDYQVRHLVSNVKRLVGQPLDRKTIAILGLAFKPGTSDVRDSLALRVINLLLDEGAIVHAHDPVAIPGAREVAPSIMYFEDPYDAILNSDCISILTAWPEYRSLDWTLVARLMPSPRVVDGRNLLDGRYLSGLGFQYLGVGLPRE